MDSSVVIRSIYLLLPATILMWGFVSSHYSTRIKAGAFLGLLWHGLFGLMLAAYGVQQDWWRFDYDDGSALYGVALDVIIAQATIAGGLLALWMRGKV